MSNISFSQSKPTTINKTTSVSLADPYDKNLSLTKVINHREDRPDETIRSINPQLILRYINEENFEKLTKITLPCKPVRSTLGLWDVMYNLVNIEGLMSCIFLADKNCAAIAHSRVVYYSQFLDFSMPTSRVHLNTVEVGDHIGIGICDIRKRMTYALIYRIVDKTTATDFATEDGLVMAINADLIQVYRVDNTGAADVIDVQETTVDPDNISIFVDWVVNASNDIPSAYPYKPHFIPVNMTFDRKEIEQRVVKQLEEFEPITFDGFEDICRGLYRQVFLTKRKSSVRRDGKGKEKSKPTTLYPPVVEIVTKDNVHFYAKIDRKGNPGQCQYMFTKESIGNNAIREYFLINKDLEDKIAPGGPGLMMLSEDIFGPGATLRYFTINY